MIRDLIQPLIEFYETREPREQIMIIIGLPMIIIFIFYLAIWEPISLSNKKLKSQLTNEQRFTQWFNQQSVLLSDTTKTFDWSTNNLPSVVEQTLEELSLNPWKKRIFQNQRKETIVTFENVPYKKLIDWVSQLNFDYQVVFRSVNMNATKTSGKVDAKLTLATTHDKQRANSPFK